MPIPNVQVQIERSKQKRGKTAILPKSPYKTEFKMELNINLLLRNIRLL